MDPLSITLASLALSSAIMQVGIAAEAAGSGWKDAEMEINQALEERKTMQKILDRLVSFKAGQSPNESLHGPRLLEAIEPLRALIAETEAAFPSNKKVSLIQRRLHWTMKGRTRKEKLLSRLNTLWNILHFPLEIEGLNFDRALLKMLHSIEEKQEKTHTDLIHLRHDIKSHHVTRPPVLPQPSLVATQKYPSPNGVPFSTMSKWLLTPGVMLLYCCSNKQTKKRYSLFLGAILPRSKVILIHWKSSYVFNMNLHFKIQNIIPVSSKIVEACKNRDVAMVQEMLASRKASPNDITDTNLTLLTFVIDARSPELVQLLLDNNADPNMTFGRWQTSPLQVAFQTRQPDIARRLIRKGADLDCISARGWSVLTYLWGRGRQDVTTQSAMEFYEICSAYGYSALQTRDLEGWTCLHRAAAYGTSEDINVLLDLGASPYAYTRGHARSPIHIAAAFDNIDTLIALTQQVTQGFLHSPDANGWTPFHVAAERGSERTLRYLLIHGADPSGKTSLGAKWFPVGLEHRDLTPEELVRNCGNEHVVKFFRALRDTGWSITIVEGQLGSNKAGFSETGKRLLVAKKHIEDYLAALQDAGIITALFDEEVFWDFDTEDVTLREE